MFQEFKAFCMRGNILDLAVGVMIGGAFSSIVSSLVNDVFMPLIGLVCGGLNVSGAFLALDGNAYASKEAAAAAGAGTLNYGMFLQKIIDFFLMALCVFLVVKLMAKLMPKKADPPKKEERKCPYCCQAIDEKATRCPHCTSELKP
ncbi:MAG: large conductance mechanosensitive channel protein MscL [Eubacteriales bacterium]|nr:large conductance mechanosensitive channel protein MscL [Eubacteriales bacterium]